MFLYAAAIGQSSPGVYWIAASGGNSELIIPGSKVLLGEAPDGKSYYVAREAGPGYMLSKVQVDGSCS
jgi:hypothetical protein